MTASTEWFQLVSVRKPNRRLFLTCLRAYMKQLAHCFCGSAVSRTAMRNSVGPFSICGLSSRLISSLPWELVAGALLLCPKLQSRFLTQVKSCKIIPALQFEKPGSKLMTASTEWFQLVSVRKLDRKLFSTCPRAYAKQLTQCFCGSAVSSNIHEKFHWPIRPQ